TMGLNSFFLTMPITVAGFKHPSDSKSRVLNTQFSSFERLLSQCCHPCCHSLLSQFETPWTTLQQLDQQETGNRASDV
ncbi:hypothetical protein FRC12_023637, partial [Ceratobasidium sp. 428]